MVSKAKEGALDPADCGTITPGLGSLPLEFRSKKKNLSCLSHCWVFYHSQPNLIPNDGLNDDVDDH